METIGPLVAIPSGRDAAAPRGICLGNLRNGGTNLLGLSFVDANRYQGCEVGASAIARRILRTRPPNPRSDLIARGSSRRGGNIDRSSRRRTRSLGTIIGSVSIQ